jgi:predicted AAA+ superfamily ATPase
MIVRNLGSLLKNSPKSVLLLGPRQVGKSTLVKFLKPDIEINLSTQATYLEHIANPNLLAEMSAAIKAKTIFVDEIQKIPHMLNSIQVLIDEDKRKKFYISGSSARKLRRGNANLIPGRIISFQMSPLSSSELNYKLDINKAMAYGCLPEIYSLSDRQLAGQILQTYGNVYLKEEIRDEALARNLDYFVRFLQSAATFSGQILDYSKMSKRAKIPRQTCVNYFEVLEDTLIAYKCPSYLDVPENFEVVRHPKFFFFDTGVLNAILGSFELSLDRVGILFENLIFTQIVNSLNSKGEFFEIFYFRTKGGVEVDCVLKYKNQIFALEAKHGHIHADDCKNLEFFKEKIKKNARCFIITNSKTKRKIGNILTCDINDFLKEIGI